MQNNTPALLVEQIAELESVTDRYIRSEIRLGRLRARTVGRHYRIDVADYERWKTSRIFVPRIDVVGEALAGLTS